MEYFNRYILGHAIQSDSLQWRHHGIGVYQAYLHEGDHDVRIHIWHPDLMLPDFDVTNGLIHDHRFSFTSFVLLGSIFDERWQFEVARDGDFQKTDEGDWLLYSTVNARAHAQEHGSPYGLHASSKPIDDYTYHASRCGIWYPAGSRYEMAPREFHRTIVQELTVTVVIKRSEVHGPARIAIRKDKTLVNAFDHERKIDSIYIKTAAQALLGYTFAFDSTTAIRALK